MKTKQLLLIALLAVVALLAAGLVAVRSLDTEEADSASAEIDLAPFAPADIEAFGYTFGGETLEFASKETPAEDESSSETETTWYLTDDPDYELDQSAISTMLVALGDLTAQRQFENTGEDYGFDEPILTNIFNIAKPYINKETGGAVLRGINMEGPFFNKAKKGAQAEKYIVDPEIEMFDRLYELSGDAIKLIDVAPELPGAVPFIERASKKCVVSIAHTTANYDQAKAAFAAGASHVTHLFNAMPPFNHRDPGVVGAASDDAAHVEMISDGIHLHPAVVRSVFRWFGAERVCLISDSMRAAGMPNGVYSLGGQTVYMTDGKATLEDGTIAGSATCLAECFRRAVSFGVPLDAALRAATINPAQAVGLFDELGSITAGKRADILVLDETLHPEKIFIGGVQTK